MLYAIHAYESSFGGLYGMDAHIIEECDSMEEAEEIALEASLNVMESYSCIIDDIYEAASEEYEQETDEWYKVVEDMKQEATAWEIYPVVDIKDKSIRELEEEFWNNKEEFIKTYCQRKS